MYSFSHHPEDGHMNAETCWRPLCNRSTSRKPKLFFFVF